MMLTRSVGLVLTALSVVSAWPIFFYESTDCNHYPVLTLDRPPVPGTCNSFGHVDIRSYSGGTRDNVEKLLLYYDAPVCYKDVAHRAYSNHTINNSTNRCIPFQKEYQVPRSYVFIEEILGALPQPVPAGNASACDTPALMVQN